METDIARWDLKALSIAAFACSCLALVGLGLLWFAIPGSLWWANAFSSMPEVFGIPSPMPGMFGILGSPLAPCGIWLCWFAFRIARKHALRARLAKAALVAGLLVFVLYVATLVLLGLHAHPPC